MAVDLGALRAKLAELKTGQKTDTDYLEKYVVLKEGETVIRILPGKGDDPFYSETAIHRINGRNIHCIGRRVCPICKYVSHLFDTKDEANIDLARKIKAKKRFYFNVIVREYENPATGEAEKDVGPKIFSCGIKLFEKILSTFVDTDFGDLTDLAEGWDFKVIKKEKDGYPNYDDSRPRPKQTPACDSVDKVKEWMDSLHDLSALIVKKEPEEIQTELDTFLGFSSDEANQTASGQTASGQTAEPTTKTESTTSEAAAVETESKEALDGSDADDFLEELRKLKENK